MRSSGVRDITVVRRHAWTPRVVAGIVAAAALVMHGGAAGAAGTTPTITAINGGAAAATTGAKVIIPIAGSGFASPKVTITGASGDVRVLGLGAGTSSTQLNVIVRLPSSNAAAGIKLVTVKNRGGGSTTGSLTLDVAPVIQSINPSNLVMGSTQPIRVDGRNFRPGATLLPVSGVRWADVTRVNSHTITASATIAAKPAGSTRVLRVSNPSDGGVSPSLSNPDNRIAFVSLPRVNGYFYFGQNSASTAVSISGLPVSGVDALTSISFGAGSSSVFDISAWNSSPSVSINGTLSFGAGATLGDRAMILTYSNGMTITNPRAVFVTPAPAVNGFDNGTPGVLPMVVADSGSPEQFTLVGTGFSTTTASHLAPTASVTGLAGVSVTTAYGSLKDQSTGYINSNHLYLSVTATSCVRGTGSLTITNPTQAGGDGLLGIVGGSVTVSGAIAVRCAPEISSITPASVAADGVHQSVTITGTNFAPGATVSEASSDVTFTNLIVVDATTITVDVSSTVAGAKSITVTNPNGDTTAVPGTIVFQSAPWIDGFSPNSVALDGRSHTITVAGGQFVDGSVITVAGTSVGGAVIDSTTFDDASQLTISVTGTVLGTIDLTVTNPDGGTYTWNGAIIIVDGRV